jgi:serine phosphatase RsbU (regulator of sigma subunit)
MALEGDDSKALTQYNRAIALAQENGSIMLEALSNELCGKFARRRGWDKIATELYFKNAYTAYQRWGAFAKARELAARANISAAIVAVELAEAPSGRVGGTTARGQHPGHIHLEDVRAEQLDALAIVRATQAISTEIVLPKLIQTLMRIVIEQAGAERGYLLLLHDDELWVEGAAGSEPASFERFLLETAAPLPGAALPLSVIGYVRRTREKVLLTQVEPNGMFSADPYFAGPRPPPRSLLCTPLVRQGELVGVLYLENGLAADAFSVDRVELLDVLTTQAAISLENASLYERLDQRVKERTRELEASLRTINENQAQIIEAERKAAVAHYDSEMAIAQQIQTSILPRVLEVPGMEIAASMVTATEVGGDYYDLQQIDDGGFWLGIGDVSGHGLNAGLIMLMIQSGLGSLMRADAAADPARLLGVVNRTLYENVRQRLGRDDFATLSLLRFFPNGRFLVAGAHEDILVWRAGGGRCEQIPTEGTWLGIAERTENDNHNREGRLEDGDVMLLYTDGITEARDEHDEQFGVGRLTEALAELCARPVVEICSEILARVRAWAPRPEDDQTIVALRRGVRRNSAKL